MLPGKVLEPTIGLRSADQATKKKVSANRATQFSVWTPPISASTPTSQINQIITSQYRHRIIRIYREVGGRTGWTVGHRRAFRTDRSRWRTTIPFQGYCERRKNTKIILNILLFRTFSTVFTCQLAICRLTCQWSTASNSGTKRWKKPRKSRESKMNSTAPNNVDRKCWGPCRACIIKIVWCHPVSVFENVQHFLRVQTMSSGEIWRPWCRKVCQWERRIFRLDRSGRHKQNRQKPDCKTLNSKPFDYCERDQW